MSAAEFDLFMGGEDEEEQDLPQPWHVYHNYAITLRDEGRASVLEWTNDVDGDGQPDPTPTGRRIEFPSLEAALRHSGRSHVRPNGVQVNVFVGEERI